ncbi:DUF423 domain-containing protein [Pseudomonas anguilliseptica]|uniref:DUF423 domain-containing protein n=1 Tax=Pseudomonas anguilliseptica TaxID=53406 RepID=UPI0022AEDFBA|nr:DUF423 domain-containing protein [Pseudomonas anguilliseptica]MCZ4320760.1 DUF423 domain-containing protein [Pseudomonas anguilliseptica]
MARLWLLLSACAGFTGVALGAFAAHGLKNQLAPAYLAVFQTATHYQLIHALALFGVGLLAILRPAPLVNCAGALFALGVVLFSGSLYALTLSGISALGVVTPFGGLAFLAGWLCLGVAAWKLGARSGT